MTQLFREVQISDRGLPRRRWKTEMSDGAAETPDFELCRAMQSYLDNHDAVSYLADLSEDLRPLTGP